MKLLITILFLFYFQAQGQSYILHWSSKGHTKYIVQKSTDNKTWSNLATVNARTTDTAFTYTLTLPVKFNYYRVTTDGLIGKSIYVYNILPIASISQSNLHIKLSTK